MNFPERFPRLETERLILREFEDRDAPAVFAMYADAETMRYGSRLPMTELREALEWIERDRGYLANREAIRWALARRTDDVAIGAHTLFHLDGQSDRAEIGYALNRECWGQGYNREAIAAILAYGFGALGLHRIEADIHPGNAASVRALEYFGFAREGLLRDRWRVGDEVSDSLMMGLLKPEWDRRP